MGDVAMIVPVLRAFVEQHPTIKITVVSRSFLQPLFNEIANVSFFSADVYGKHKGFFGLRKLYVALKELKPTHFADLHNVTRSKIVRQFFKSARISVAFIDKGRAEKKALTRTKNKVFKQLKTSHQRYADVFTELGFTINISNPKFVEKPILFNKVEDMAGKKTQLWIGIAPFATFASKEYPLDLMEEVLKLLSEKKYQLFLFGGKEDAEKLELIANNYQNATSVASKLKGLKNELNLISNLDIMLSMDSGNAHLAAMVGVKTVTLWGNTHPFAGFAPFNQPVDYCITPNLKEYPNLPCSVYGNKACKGYEDVMQSISPNRVVEKIISVLA